MSNWSVENLAKAADRRFKSSTFGNLILNGIILLSGFLSAVFFWQHAQYIFSGVPVLLAAVIGLMLGTVPAEIAFWGWENIQGHKTDMTTWQIRSAGLGMWAGVAFAAFNVVSIFLTSFPEIPQAIQDVRIWIVFIALIVPIPAQLLFVAIFKTNEQSVLEAKHNARIHALKLDANFTHEKARIEAEILGTTNELNAALGAYGSAAGKSKADAVLRDGFNKTAAQTHDDMEGMIALFQQFLSEQGSRPTPETPAPRPSILDRMLGKNTQAGESVQMAANGAGPAHLSENGEGGTRP